MLTTIKNNSIVRGVYAIFKEFIISRGSFGHIDKTTILCPPILFTTKKNVYLYEHSKIGEHSYIASVNAKFIMKKWSGAGNGLNVHAGNHPMVVGRFYRTITNDEKGYGYDKDIIVNEDVWIGSNVTLLSGAVVGRGSTIAAGAVVNKEVPPYSVVGGGAC